MKKTFEKSITIANIAIAAIMLLVLLLLSLGVIDAAELNNNAVKVMFFVLLALYVVTSGILVKFAFTNEEALKDVLLEKNGANSSIVTKKVINKLIKKAVKAEEGLKIKNIKIFTGSHTVSVRVTVNIKGGEAPVKMKYLEMLVHDTVLGALKFEFDHIEIKLMKYETDFVADKKKLMEDAKNECSAEEPSRDGECVCPDAKSDEASGSDETVSEPESDGIADESTTESKESESDESESEEIK